MSTLSSKSAQEISELLDVNGIKHGPVVDTTRPLYEKKLLAAMGKKKGAKPPSPDKTFYREEKEEVTYVSYRTPLRSEGCEDRESSEKYTQMDFSAENPSLRARSNYTNEAFVDKPYDAPSTYSTMSYSNAPPVKASVPVPQEKSSRLIPLWVQFLVFLVVAVFLYALFYNMESAHSGPFKGIK